MSILDINKTPVQASTPPADEKKWAKSGYLCTTSSTAQSSTAQSSTAHGDSFAVEFVKICRYKTFRMRIVKRTTFLLFRCCSIHVKLCVLATYSAKN